MEDIIRWLMTMINFNTTCDTGNEYECARYIDKVLREYSIDTEIWTVEQNRSSLAAWVCGRSDKTLVLHAHMDTAEYGNASQWKFPPYKALHKKGCILGRGALDCKGQLAVWMKIITDIKQAEKQPEYSVLLLATADEECGGKCGLGYISSNTDILKNAFLVIGEGGGFPFPFKDTLFYTFQTGEREDFLQNQESDEELPLQILEQGIRKGYYTPDIKEYYLQQHMLEGRRLDVSPLYAGMKDNFLRMDNSFAYSKYGELFMQALRQYRPQGQLMPVITPGYSDNRYFRRLGIPTVGFFPLDERNSLSGIHGKNEYISEKSLALAYAVMEKIIFKLILL